MDGNYNNYNTDHTYIDNVLEQYLVIKFQKLFSRLNPFIERIPLKILMLIRYKSTVPHTKFISLHISRAVRI